MRRSARLVAVWLAAVASSLAQAEPHPRMLARPSLPPSPAWQPPAPVGTETAGGTRVVVLSDARLPLAHVMVTIDAGSALDPPERPGLAAAVLSMLQDGGAATRSAPQLAEAFSELGAELHETIEPDQASLELTVLSRNLPRALTLLADLVARPRFDAVEWQRLRARRVAEIERRRDDRSDVADDTFLRALYGDHPYAHMPLGTPASLRAITVAELQAFHRAHYGPRTIAFLVVGDAAPAATTAAVARALGEWRPPVAPPSPPPAPPPPATQAKLVLVDQPGAPQSELRVGFLGRPRTTPDFPSLLVLRMVLGGSFTSRLNQNLREKHGYAYGAQAHFDFWRAAGPFRAQAAVRSDVTAAALGEMLREIAAMRAPLGDGELQKARALVHGAIVEAFGDGELTCAYLADLVAHALPLDAWTRLPQKLAALDVASVTKVADAIFAPQPLTIVVVGDRKLVEPSLRALPFPISIEHRDADGKLVP